MNIMKNFFIKLLNTLFIRKFKDKWTIKKLETGNYELRLTRKCVYGFMITRVLLEERMISTEFMNGTRLVRKSMKRLMESHSRLNLTMVYRKYKYKFMQWLT